MGFGVWDFRFGCCVLCFVFWVLIYRSRLSSRGDRSFEREEGLVFSVEC